MMKTLRIGIDDTDSPKGMCTTYLAYRIVGELRNRGDTITEYPRLIRLNPNVPWKTRGNGAVGITVKTTDPKGAKKRVESMVRKYSDTANGANPGLVFLESDKVPQSMCELAKEALWRVVPRSKAKQIAKDAHLEFFTIGNGQGLVGAISAIGYEFGDSTMELLTYRKGSKIGRPRRIEEKSVREMHEHTFPATYNSYDSRTQRVLIAPHGPDPVLYGIRGEDAKTLIKASSTIRGETPAGHMVFVSNQGTGDHLTHELDPKNMQANESGTITGRLCADAHVMGGGHVRLVIDSHGMQINCHVYHKTGMGELARSLIKGDTVCVGGGVRSSTKSTSLNVETIRVDSLAGRTRKSNPMCKACSKRMKSKGIAQGFKCVRCGRTASAKEQLDVPRSLGTGLYVAQPSAQRHLARPAHRTHRTTTRKMRPQARLWVC